MKYHILLDSSFAKLQPGIGSKQKSHDFTVNFAPPIVLGSEKTHLAGLNKLITMSYSWYNIAEAYGNNKLKWRKRPGTWQTLTFPDGMYDYGNIKNFLQAQTGFVDPNAANKEPIFDLSFNTTV